MSNVKLIIEGDNGAHQLKLDWTNETVRWRRAVKKDREIIAIERTFSDLATASVPAAANKPNRHRTKKIRKNR